MRGRDADGSELTQLRNRTGVTTEQLEVSLGGPAQSTQMILNPSAGFRSFCCLV